MRNIFLCITKIYFSLYTLSYDLAMIIAINIVLYNEKYTFMYNMNKYCYYISS